MQKCKNCGAILKPGVKFCTKCGTPVDGVVSEEREENNNISKSISNNETIDNIKKHSLNYFAWYKKSISKPSEVDYSNKFFGLASIIISALIGTFAFYAILNKLFSTAKTAVNAASEYAASSLSNSLIPTGFKLYFQLFLMVLAYYAVLILVGFVCKKYLINRSTNLFDYMNQLGGYGNSMIIFQLLLVIFLLMIIPSDLNSVSALSAASISALGSFKFLVILMMIISSIGIVSYVGSIIIVKGSTNLDKIYVGIITLVLSSAVLYFVFQIIASSLLSKYISTFSSFF